MNLIFHNNKLYYIVMYTLSFQEGDSIIVDQRNK